MPRKQTVVRRKSAAVLDAQPGVLTTKSVEAEIRPVKDEDTDNPNGEFVMVLSKDNLDRDAENLWADEWMHPLPSKIHMDTDHAFSKGLSVPHTAGSGVPTIDDDGNLLVKGSYAGTPHGQLTRQLVKEGHIWQGSVAYQTHVLDDGHVVRELLNGTFTGVPANPEAVVLSSKSTIDKIKEHHDHIHANAVDRVVHGKAAARFADPGYQQDKQPRYPIDTADHVRAALSYFGVQKNRDKYTKEQQSAIMGRIRSRARALGIGQDAQKTLMLGMLKAIAESKTSTKNTLTGDATDVAGNLPARTIVGDDVGAMSNSTDGNYGYDEDNDSDDGDDDFDDEVSLLQAVHDTAVALGAMCDDDDMKSIHRFMTTMKDVANSAYESGGGVLQNFVTTPVSTGWGFVVAGPPGSEMYTLSQGDTVIGHGKLEDVANAKALEAAKTKSSNADGEDSEDESDSDEDTADAEKSDSSDTKSYELTLADGSTIIIDASNLKVYDPSARENLPEPPEGEEPANANTEPPENSAGAEEAANPVDAQSVAAAGATTDDVNDVIAGDETGEKSATPAEDKPSPGVLAAKARMRKFMLDQQLADAERPDDENDSE